MSSYLVKKYAATAITITTTKMIHSILLVLPLGAAGAGGGVLGPAAGGVGAAGAGAGSVAGGVAVGVGV